ncbi:hypothetical protein K491DRAFT_686486 [Lophiostoma macrostomum CBS 122681]|uniref:Uncharacterized protein n=1 Tax=Lophiostoma macrostomum CBS 122681 TaxID=1314788 RepID=A0A6A6TT37_9PLEO|nr:hypothetical protein K491DRAFT_686486 [Lophiostoma macrostomum CBS 122681]
MGVVISKGTLNPLSFVSTVIGFISFAFTLATFLRVFWDNLQTIAAAPGEINDFLSTLKQGLLEERRHLRKVRRRRKSMRGNGNHNQNHVRGRSDYSSDDDRGQRRRYSQARSTDGGNGNANGSRKGGHSRGRKRKGAHHHHERMNFDRDLQALDSSGEAAALASLKLALRDMIRQFRHLEYPFLRPEFQSQTNGQWSTSGPYPFTPAKAAGNAQQGYGGSRSRKERDLEKSRNEYEDGHGYGYGYGYDEDEGSSGLQATNRLGSEYRKCGLKERWLWVKRKPDVITLSEALSRLEVRRTAHEVGEVVIMVGDIGRDLEDIRDSILALEGRMSRVVGVRRVDG